MSDVETLRRLDALERRDRDRRGVELPLTASGTWTPVLEGSGTAGSFTYTVQAGTYTRVGDVVFFRLRVQISAITVAPTGNLQISGLPLTSVTIGGGAGVSGGGACTIWQGITLPANYTQLMARVVSGMTVVNLTRGGSNVGQANVQGGELALVAGVANFEIEGQYQV